MKLTSLHISLLIALAAVALVGAIALAALDRTIPDVVAQTVSYIIAGLFGGAAGVGAHGVAEDRARKQLEKDNEAWRADVG